MSLQLHCLLGSFSTCPARGSPDSRGAWWRPGRWCRAGSRRLHGGGGNKRVIFFSLHSSLSIWRGRCAEKERCVNRFGEVQWHDSEPGPRPGPLIASKSICTPLPRRSPAISDREGNSEVRRKLRREVWGPSLKNVGVSLQLPSHLQALEGMLLPAQPRPLSDWLTFREGRREGCSKTGPLWKSISLELTSGVWAATVIILRAISENPNCQQ